MSRLIALLTSYVSTLGEYSNHFSINDIPCTSLPPFILAGLILALGRFFSRLCSLNYSYLEALIHQNLDIFVKHLLGESDVQSFLFNGSLHFHPGQVQQFMAQYSVGVENLVELAQFEEYDLFVIFLFYLPELNHRA